MPSYGATDRGTLQSETSDISNQVVNYQDHLSIQRLSKSICFVLLLLTIASFLWAGSLVFVSFLWPGSLDFVSFLWEGSLVFASFTVLEVLHFQELPVSFWNW